MLNQNEEQVEVGTRDSPEWDLIGNGFTGAGQETGP